MAAEDLSALERSYTCADAARLCWAVRMACDCGHEMIWPAEQLRRFPARLSVAALARQSVCSECGRQGPAWHFRQDHGATREADRARNGAAEIARSS